MKNASNLVEWNPVFSSFYKKGYEISMETRKSDIGFYIHIIFIYIYIDFRIRVLDFGGEMLLSSYTKQKLISYMRKIVENRDFSYLLILAK